MGGAVFCACPQAHTDTKMAKLRATRKYIGNLPNIITCGLRVPLRGTATSGRAFAGTPIEISSAVHLAPSLTSSCLQSRRILSSQLTLRSNIAKLYLQASY